MCGLWTRYTYTQNTSVPGWESEKRGAKGKGSGRGHQADCCRGKLQVSRLYGMKEGGELSGPLPWQAPTRLFGRGSLLQTFYKKFGTVWGIQTLVSGSFSLVKHHANPRPGTVSDVTGDQIGVPLCLLWVWQPTNWALRTWFWHPPKDGKVEGAEPEEKAEDEATTGPACCRGKFQVSRLYK